MSVIGTLSPTPCLLWDGENLPPVCITIYNVFRKTVIIAIIFNKYLFVAIIVYNCVFTSWCGTSPHNPMHTSYHLSCVCLKNTCHHKCTNMVAHTLAMQLQPKPVDVKVRSVHVITQFEAYLFIKDPNRYYDEKSKSKVNAISKVTIYFNTDLRNRISSIITVLCHRHCSLVDITK